MGKQYTNAGIARFFCGLLTVLAVGVAQAQEGPPSRVARLGYQSGNVSCMPAGETEWVTAVQNRPYTTGDSVYTDTGARTELQMGAATVRMDSTTSLKILNLDDNVAQFEVQQGTVNLHILKKKCSQVYEVNTPNLAFSIREPGNYLIVVAADGSSTTTQVIDGEAEVFGTGGVSYMVEANQSCQFTGQDLGGHNCSPVSQPSEFVAWSDTRAARRQTSVSARYVSSDVIGHQDLDDNGSWQTIEGQGNVWAPRDVPEGWSPYQDGHWSWVQPWGWTWVDNSSWGFATSHYGRWSSYHDRWYWAPGPQHAEPVYAPALVGFVGGVALGAALGSQGNIGWFPLGPSEVYVPPYQVNQTYFNKINNSNTVISNTTINNFYNNPNATGTFSNQRIQGAVHVVSAKTFVNAQPVNKALVPVNAKQIAAVPVTHVAAVAPVKQSVIGAATVAKATPPPAVMQQRVICKTDPPPAPVPFKAQQSALAKNPGQPLSSKTISTLQSTQKVSTASTYKVVKPVSTKPATLPNIIPDTSTVSKPGIVSQPAQKVVAPATTVKPGITAKPVAQPPQKVVAPVTTAKPGTTAKPVAQPAQKVVPPATTTKPSTTVAKPAPHPVHKAAPPVAKPAPHPVYKTAPPVAKPAPRPVHKTAPPAAKPAAHPVRKPAAKPAYKPATKPESVHKPASHPKAPQRPEHKVVKPAARPAAPHPASHPAPRPAAPHPAARPAPHPAPKPAAPKAPAHPAPPSYGY